MKAQILKIAGVKNEKEFYRKFPTEEAFMKKHGKELKKAQVGIQLDGVMGKPFQGMPKKFNKFSVPETLQLNTDVSQNPYMGGSLIGGKKPVDPNLVIGSTKPGASSNLLSSAVTALPEIISGISGIMQDQENLDKSRKYAKLAKLVANSPQEKLPQRQYVIPEDMLVNDPNKYGIAQNGAFIGGNPTEIQNMYNPNDLYSNLGYEPLNDSNPKQYQFGGNVDYSTLTPLLGNFASGVGSSARGGGFKQGNIGQVASAIGGVAGTAIGGPLGGMIGSTFGGLIGGGFDADTIAQQEALAEERDSLFGSAAFGNVRQKQFGAYTKNGGSVPSYEDGGYMNPEYNPQMIAKFGDYDVDKLFKPPYDADMLRSGGHLAQVNYTPPSAQAMYTGRNQMEYGGQMAMGGDLQVHRGKAETISYNPFLPNGGETVMFRGPSHDNGGMPISYGENGVEVEGGEPAQIMQDGGDMQNGNDEGNLLVFGNLMKPGTNQKFKNYIADLSKIEAKQNKLVDKTTTLINNADVNDQFDKLSLNTGQVNLIGANMKLKDIANKKKDAAAEQNAILDTAKEFGVESDALAKGKIKYAKANDPYAKFGAKMETFQKGGKTSKINLRETGNLAKLYQKAVSTKDPIAVSEFQRVAFNTLGANEIKKLTGVKDTKKFVDGVFGPSTNKLGKAVSQKAQQMVLPASVPSANELIQYPDEEQAMYQSTYVPPQAIGMSFPDQENYIAGMSDVEMAKRNQQSTADNKNNLPKSLLTGLKSLMPYLRPSNQMELDPAQLSGEMYAMATNKKQPVFAQTFTPDLSQPTRISLQDQVNQVTAQANASKRLVQNNPTALAFIDAQAKKSIGEILGEQFRMNQGEQQRSMEINRQTMNDAKLKNLGIRQEQADKMAAVDVNTRRENQAILNSVSAKMLQNKAQNKQLAIMENMSNYRFDPQGRAYSLNAPYEFNMYGNEKNQDGVAPAGYEFYKAMRKKGATKDDDPAVVRNGSIVKAIKGL